MTGSPVAPAPVPAGGGGNSSAGTRAEGALEQRLLHTLQAAKAALAASQLPEAAQLMQAANGLCEAALRDPSSLSRSGLAEIQRLFAVCLEAGRPLQDQLMQRIAERGTVTKAAKAYRPRRGPR